MTQASVERTRRDFLFRCACGGAALATGLGLPCRSAHALGYDDKIEVRHYDKLPGQTIQCHVCPLHCMLADRETCFCRTRTNHGGVLYNHSYNSPCVLNVDPIEKTPLLHFLPGTKTLALGLAGCNLRCLYCQNWQVAQEQPVNTKNLKLTAADAVAQLQNKDLPTITFTYTEPVSYYEYALETAAAVRQSGRKAVMASAAFITVQPMKELCEQLHGMALALKGFTEEFYLKVCGVKFAPILKAIEAAKASGRWLELTTLVIPTYNDAPKDIREMARWIVKNLGPDVPLHFGRFVPEYKLRKLPQTPVATLEECRNIALGEGLRFVYISNVAPHDGNHTYCPGCKNVVIRRVGLRLLENNLKNGRCPKCQREIPGVWA
ncbi:MAG: AmmeMemoRadiSam system radical SAM enzyme [Planctomycetota bacterium]|nr:AmmeMemoRadiSam system radical SAM enzyme [Planctomycetota bacterium]